MEKRLSECITDLLLRGTLSIVALHLNFTPGNLVKLPVCSLPQVWVHILQRQWHSEEAAGGKIEQSSIGYHSAVFEDIRSHQAYLRWHDMNRQLLLEHHIAIHCFRSHCGHLWILKLQKSIVLGLSCLLVARQPDLSHAPKLCEET